jgi:N4-gp56 family major capsid protein
MQVTIEETLAASNVTTALTNGPYLIFAQVLEGARRPLAFLEVVKEDFSLIGKDGNTIKYLKASQLSASAASEATVIASGMSSADKSLTAVSVSVTDIIYSATQLSDVLTEDYPSIDWVRMQMTNMGSAIMEYIDALVYTTIWAASGTSTASTATLDFDTVTSAVSKMENNSWVADEARPPFIILAPDAVQDLLNDTHFTETRRYTTYNISKIVQGEIGLFGGCRVLKSPLLDGTGRGIVVMPPNHKNGPVVVLAWKRRIRIRNEYQAKYEYTYYVTTARAKPVVVQAEGICKISITGSP